MFTSKKFRNAVIALGVMAAVGAGAAVAGAGDDDDAREKPITGAALDRASEAALDHTGGGRVSDTEAGDEEGAYEVEVTRGDGSEVDVHLDEDFRVLSTEAEDKREDADEQAGEGR